MEILHLRNATIKLNFGEFTFLIDPYFAKVFTEPSMGGISKNPTSELPIPTDEILDQVDYLFISHLHPDHFDGLAQQIIPKNIPVICQPENRVTILSMGFSEVITLENRINLGNVTIHKTPGSHGFGKIAELMGPVSGAVFQSKIEKTLYWLGDTVFDHQVQKVIDHFSPQILICHAGGNKFFRSYDFLNLGLQEDTLPLIMDGVQLEELIRYVQTAQVVVTHLGALDHETETREGLQQRIEAACLDSSLVFIPENGTKLTF